MKEDPSPPGSGCQPATVENGLMLIYPAGDGNPPVGFSVTSARG